MSDKEAARAEVQKLVEKFRAVPAATRRQYSEQETRIRFILPLFRALGWDDTNPAEVSAEEQISRGFVDFGYYLNGVPVFYLETKKIHSKLSDPDNMRQSINYAYLKGVTWAVLTDFEGLMVFNAEWEEKDPIKARFLDLQWEHYANGHFDDLWLLSRHALQTREIDRVAERFGKKAKKEPVTKTLFSDLTQWRHDLFNDIHLMKTTLWASDPRKVDNAVQKLLDRLIFIRSVEDRGVEAKQLLPLLRQSKRSELSAKLMRLFRDLDTVYNSNLFAQSELDLMELHDTNLLVDIINGLYKARGGFVTYDFNAISADVLGAVYEQYLGFRAQDPEAKQKIDKSKKRKSQGIYYTPQFVVKYIVAQTVGKVLTPDPLPPTPSPLHGEGEENEPPRRQKRQENLLAAEDVFKLRILDPACGSGSFLIETFDVLDRHLSRLNPKATAAERREWRRRILTECLYGVDLDDQAVEVTRLNLMLRAAQERGKLPLLTHIAHGNSLIEDPAVAGETAFKWEERFPEVMERGGFDVVIGNPPYGAEVTTEAVDYMRRCYQTAANTLDTFALFMEKSSDLLKTSGLFGMIVPSGWVSTPSTRLLRNLFIERLKPTAFASLPYDVFKGAYIDTVIVVGERLEHGQTLRDIASAPVTLTVFPPRFIIQGQQDFDSFSKRGDAVRWLDGKDNQFLITVSDLESTIVDRMRNIGGKFADIADIQRGVTPFNTTKHEPAINPAPAFVGTVRRYTITNEPLEFIQYDQTLSEYKPIRYFQGERLLLRELISRQFQLQAAYTNEHFITNKSMQSLVISDNQYHVLYVLGLLNSKLMSWYFLQTNSVARRDDFPKIILKQTRELPFRKIKFDDADDETDKNKHDRMVELVETMLRLKQEHAAAEGEFSDRRHELAEQIEYTDRQIDKLVYELYGLTADEIRVVEG